MTNGLTILIEGLDLAGKSTLVRNLKAELTREGYSVRYSRNALCSDNPLAALADDLRRDSDASFLETGALFLASHLWDARQFQPPPAGTIHIQDSSWLRTLAFHAFHQTSAIPALLSTASAAFPRFDAAIFLTAAIEQRQLRLWKRAAEEPGSNDANDAIVVKDPESYLTHEKLLRTLTAAFTGATVLDTTGISPDIVLANTLDLLSAHDLLPPLTPAKKPTGDKP